MQDIQLGARVRAIRLRRGQRQADLARLAGASRGSVSRLERGHLETLSVRAIRAIAGALEIKVDMVPRWRGGDLERVVSGRHAALAEAVVGRLVAFGWTVRPEVSFSIYGERGIIDLLAWRADVRSLLVIELKTEIVDVGELLGTLDRKVRLAPQIALDLGWRPSVVSEAVVIAESRTNHRRVAEHVATLRSALPDDGRRLRGWLATPLTPIRALAFMTDARPRSVGRGFSGRRRVITGGVGVEADRLSTRARS